jgi:predicted S18 family serine protease
MMGYANYPRKIFSLMRPVTWAAALMMAVLTMAGCANAPVQEMSNARQAIRAAKDAGATQTAPQTLADAEKLLSQAEISLNHHEFRMARHYAVTARTRAVDALSEAQTQTDNAGH